MRTRELAVTSGKLVVSAPKELSPEGCKMFGDFSCHTKNSAGSATVGKSRTREPFREVSMTTERVPDQPDHVQACD